MNLVITHKNNNFEKDNGDFLDFVWTNSVLTHLVIDSYFNYSMIPSSKVICAVPREWFSNNKDEYKDSIISYNDSISLPSNLWSDTGLKIGSKKWHVISNGRYFTMINENLIQRILNNVDSDIVLVNADKGLLGEREIIRLTDNDKVAGFRRYYTDSVRQSRIPEDWPAYIFVKPEIFNKLLVDNSLSLSFLEILNRCKENKLEVCTLNAGGVMLDIGKEEDLLQFCAWMLEQKNNLEMGNSLKIASDSRLEGKVLLGDNVLIDSKAVIIGPAIIGDNIVIEEKALIHNSIIGSGVSIKSNQSIQDRVISKQHELTTSVKNYTKKANIMSLLRSSENCFRKWPKYSYARFLKRIADIIFALLVLTLFAPLFPFIAIAIKLTSPGPIFYGHKRQGLHGKEFRCLKFRTMITGANEIQQKLRHISQVDGPQFKIDDDPRINFVGKFLRETYIDEIPQFINVLLGQMSVVGPRPSPESENTLCPSWRDARLSVRPGITGLWQLYRTREPMKDFQEWIYYDTEYVRKLSLRIDWNVCWRTAKKMLDTFINQF